MFYHTYRYSNGNVYVEQYEHTEILKIKDISFGAYIENVNYTNKESEHYIAENDNGSFIISTNYSYKGSSLPEGYGEDAANCALSLVSDVLEVIPGAGQVKDVFDLVVDSIDAVKTSWEISNKIIEGYDVDLTNGAFVGTQFHTSKESQLAEGGLNRYAFTSFETSMDNPVLYLPNQNEGVTYRYCIGTTNHWKTRLTAGVALDIVTETAGLNKSHIENKYENVKSTWFTVDFWGESEQAQNIMTEESTYIDMLSNTTKEISVTAPYSSEYEISIPGAEFSIYDSTETIHKTSALNKATIDLEAGERVIVKLNTTDNELHTTFIVNCKPKTLNIDNTEIFKLKPYGNKIYSFNSTTTQSILFDTNNNIDLGIKLYDADGNLIGDYNSKNVNYLCSTGEVLYIKVYNNSNTTISNAALSLSSANTIDVNKTTNLILNGNDTVYIPLDIWCEGKYIVQGLPTSVSYRFLNATKGEVTALTNNCYLELTNLSAAQQTLSFVVEFSPTTVKFGNTNTSYDKFVKFETYTDEVYKLPNTIKVYDYNFNQIAVTDGLIYLQANGATNKYYYMDCTNVSTLTIEVPNTNLSLETEQTVTSNEKGFYYFKIDVTVESDYKINASAQIYIYDENMENRICVASGVDFGLHRNTASGFCSAKNCRKLSSRVKSFSIVRKKRSTRQPTRFSPREYSEKVGANSTASFGRTASQ